MKFAGLPAGKFRHKDHRFEWTRAQFEAWAQGVAARFGYNVRFGPVGNVIAPADTVVMKQPREVGPRNGIGRPGA